MLAHPFVSLLLTSFFSFTFLLLAAAAAAAVGPVYLFSRNRAQKIEFILASLQFYASAIQKNERRGSPFSSILFFFLLLYTMHSARIALTVDWRELIQRIPFLTLTATSDDD